MYVWLLLAIAVQKMNKLLVDDDDLGFGMLEDVGYIFFFQAVVDSLKCTQTSARIPISLSRRRCLLHTNIHPSSSCDREDRFQERRRVCAEYSDSFVPVLFQIVCETPRSIGDFLI